jgi:DNA-binding NarL/FixJ family response regulator
MSRDEGPVRVVVATDSFLIGDGLMALFASIDDIEVVGRARDHDEMLKMAAELDPEAIIISIRTPVISTMATIAVARRLRMEHGEMGIVIISDRGNGFALELLRGGASRIAFLLDDRLPSVDTVVGALREVRAGQSVLSPTIVDSLVHRSNRSTVYDLTVRELDILQHVAHGLSNRAIAAELGISIKAIEKSVATVYRKLNLVDQSLVDRRVTATLAFLRAQTDPFVPHLSTSAESPDATA